MSKKDKPDYPRTDEQEYERRREPRVHTDLRVKIFAGGEYFAGVSKNLSCGGMLIRAPKEVLGKELEKLQISIPDYEAIAEVDADVAWAAESQDECATEEEMNIGFEFKELDEEVKDQIKDYIEKFLKQQKK